MRAMHDSWNGYQSSRGKKETNSLPWCAPRKENQHLISRKGGSCTPHGQFPIGVDQTTNRYDNNFSFRLHAPSLRWSHEKILELLINGPLKVRLSTRARRKLSRRMICLKAQTVSEFQRKPWPIDCFAKWKATEFRFFLLYCGPFVLKNLLPKNL